MGNNTIFSLKTFIAATLMLLGTCYASAQNVSMVSYEQNWDDTEGTLTLKNNSPQRINNVKFRIIYYDMSGTQLDYKDYSENIDIEPGMTRRLDIPAFEHRRDYCYYESKGASTSTRFKIKFTELDSDDGTEQLTVSNANTVGKRSEYAYTIVEIMPSFKGNVNVWLAQHLQYPTAAAKKGVQGKIIVRFVVEPDGSLSNISVVRPVDPDLDKEAIRCICSMPKWNPGYKDGKPAAVWYTLPVTFKLQ